MFGKQLVQSIKDASPAGSEMLVWPMGQMGFVIKTASATLVFDLYLSRNGKCRLPAPFAPGEVDFADLFFGSHDHGDHIDRPAWKAFSEASGNALFAVPKMQAAKLSNELGIASSRFVGISDGVTSDIGGVMVTGVAAAHEFLDRDTATGEYPCMGYIVEVGGRRIYHAGDTCLYEGIHQKLRARGKIDLMLLPINGRSGFKYRTGIIGNMTYQEAADLAGTIEPELVVPCHYNMHSGNLEDPQLFADFIEAKYPAQRCMIMEPFKMCTL